MYDNTPQGSLGCNDPNLWGASPHAKRWRQGKAQNEAGPSVMDFEVSGFCALRGRNGAPWNMLMTTNAAEEIVRPALSKRREGSVSVDTLCRVLAHPDLMREVGPVATALDGRAPATQLAGTFAPTPA